MDLIREVDFITEGWKNNVAHGALAVAALAGIAKGTAPAPQDLAVVDGKEYTRRELPSDMSKVKKTKDSKGRLIYTWVEKAGMKPQYTYYHFASVNDK